MSHPRLLNPELRHLLSGDTTEWGHPGDRDDHQGAGHARVDAFFELMNSTQPMMDTTMDSWTQPT